MDYDAFAQEAYQAYGVALDQHGLRENLPLAAWEDLSQAERDVWHQVVVRITRRVYAEQSVVYVADEEKHGRYRDSATSAAETHPHY